MSASGSVFGEEGFSYEQLVIQASREWEHFLTTSKDFFNSVDWKEPLMVGLIAFHAFTLLFVVATRHHTNIQTMAFFLILGMVALAEQINIFCIENWSTIATKQYFDKGGAFITIVYSAPLLLFAFIILINFLLDLFSLLVAKKTAELKQKRAGVKRGSTNNDSKNKSTNSAENKKTK